MGQKENTFVEDLKKGQKTEEEFVEILKEFPALLVKLIRFNRQEGRFAEWDIEAKATFEVKFDEYSRKSGNLCFEIKSLSETKSDYFVYKYFNKGVSTPKWVVFKTSELIEDIEIHKNKCKNIMAVGDNPENLAYLFLTRFVEETFSKVLLIG